MVLDLGDFNDFLVSANNNNDFVNGGVFIINLFESENSSIFSMGQPFVSFSNELDIQDVTESDDSLDIVPTPAAILPGLLGMGLSAVRKRRVTSSEDA